MNFYFVTDSTADLPEAIRSQYDVRVVPLKVHFGSETYLDGQTLSSDQFYPMLAESSVLPTTSQPSPVDFLHVYQDILEADPHGHIISIHLSAAFSGTYQSAELASSLLEQEGAVTVIDSRSTSYGIGMLVAAAAEAAAQGKSKEDILELVQQVRASNRVYFLVDTLEYLQKGGRIGKASAVLGSLLNIKPILSIDDEGEVTSVDKVRGSKKAVRRIVEMFKQAYSGDVDIAIAHANAHAAADHMVDTLTNAFSVKNCTMTQLGPVIGTHVGAGTIGVFMGPTRG